MTRAWLAWCAFVVVPVLVPGCGGGSGDSDADVDADADTDTDTGGPEVRAMYPSFGGNWNDWLTNDGSGPLDATDSNCDPHAEGA